jgi:predicted RNA-binding protein Jag
MRLSKHAEQLVTEFLVDFFKALDENPEIQVAYTDGDPYINITGLTGNGTFLTRDQMCLSALQHIVNVVVHKDREGAPGIVTVRHAPARNAEAHGNRRRTARQA